MGVTKEKLRSYLVDCFDAGEDLADRAPLLTGTVIDSFGLVELLSFIEKEEGTRIGPTEVTVENFDSLERIMSFLESRRQGLMEGQ